MLFPERLRQLRMQSGMKQREVARAVGVDIPMYSRYEHGERRPKRDQVVRLARLFHSDPDELVALWLAFNALNEIGNDPLAELAMEYLKAEVSGNGDEVATVSVAPEILPAETAAQPVPHETEPQPEQAPVTKVVNGLVTELGDTPFPKFIQGDLLEILGQIEDDSIDCVLTSVPLDRTVRSNADVMREVKRVLKTGGSVMLSKAGHELNENMCRRLLEAACPDQGILLDLCCGTGMTCKTAFDMKLRSIGISADPESLQKAHKLVQQTPLSLF